MLPIGFDWLGTYAPAALAVWQGQSPYTVPIYYAAPWAVFPLIPFALMPYVIGRICIFVIGLSAFAYIAYRMGAKPLTMALFIFSFPVISDLYHGNIEWMPMLGFVLPPQIGLIFVLIKPQIGIGVTIYWLVDAWQAGGIKQVIKTFSPVTLVFLASFAAYGFWPLRFFETLALVDHTKATLGFNYNSSLFPYGIIIGLFLLHRTITRKDKRAGIAAGPFFSPYTVMATYGAPLVTLIDKPWFFIIAWAITWIPVLARLLIG